MSDVMQILKELDTQGLLRVGKQSGDYMMVHCPAHSDGNEKHPSCGVLLQEQFRNGKRYPEGWFHCFSCGLAKILPDALDLILKNHSVSQNGIEWLKENFPDYEIDGQYVSDEVDSLIPSGMIAGLNATYAVDFIASLTAPKPDYVPESELATYRYTVPYMYERKLTDELIEKFDIGFDGKWIPEGKSKPVPCITFPVRDRNGNTLFLCRRSIKGKIFNYPKDVTKPVYGIYELPKNCKSVVVCESCLNALTSWRYGRPAVALLGTGTSYQIQQLKELGVHEFILALDPDDAGRKGTAKLRSALKSVAIVWEFTGIPAGMDINNLTEEEFNALEMI